jgi:hypothetical protein
MILSHPEKRKAEAERIRQKYPDRIPVSLQSEPVYDDCLLIMPPLLSGHLRESGSDRHPIN